MSSDCAFCALPPDQVIARHGPCLALWTSEPPEGSVMVVPIEHRRTAWDLTAEEWGATQALLRQLRDQVAESHRPDGWNIGWNVETVGGQSVMHAHCHLVPRYADETYAGRGLRWWIKQPDNTRGAG